MSAVWEREDLPATQKLVMLALADWANDEGLCWPSIARIAVKSSLKERAVQMAIRQLEDAGFIKREELTGRGNRYWLSMPPHEMHPRMKCTPPPHEMHPTPALDAPNTSMTHQLTTNVISALPDWLPVDAWNGWLEMRVKRKKPLTERARTRALNKLEQMAQQGQDVAEVLDRSTMNGWTDLYEIKGASNGKHSKQDGVDAALDNLFEPRGFAGTSNGQPVGRIGSFDQRAITSR
jgi:DNA-binding MarR family transcriptional regulator